MEPKRLLWLLIFVYSARWLVPAQIQSQSEKEIRNTEVRSLVPSPPLEKYNETKISIVKTQVLLKSWSTSLKRKMMTLTEAKSLSGLLGSVVQKSLSECRLVLVYDTSALHSLVVQDLLLLLSNKRQVGMAVLLFIYFYIGASQ